MVLQRLQNFFKTLFKVLIRASKLKFRRMHERGVDTTLYPACSRAGIRAEVEVLVIPEPGFCRKFDR